MTKGGWRAARHFHVAVIAATVFLAAFQPHRAAAQIGSDRYASIVVDAATGSVLSEVAADEPRYPASLTKMMTLYMTFEALRDHRVAYDQYVPVSPWAASMMPSKLGLVPGTLITVEQAILGLVTKSANDAAAALGEMLGGDEERFGQMMTLRARALGMTHTVFRNASGLPDPDQYTTARDLAILARHLVQDFPNEYRYFSVPSFVFHGRPILNHDHMLQSYPGADGLKTGYINASGFNLVTSAVRGGVRLIGVVLGAGSGGQRDVHMTALLDRGYESMGVSVAPYREMARLSLVSSAEAAPMRGALLAPRIVRRPIPAAHPVRVLGPVRIQGIAVRGPVEPIPPPAAVCGPKARRTACLGAARHLASRG